MVAHHKVAMDGEQCSCHKNSCHSNYGIIFNRQDGYSEMGFLVEDSGYNT